MFPLNLICEQEFRIKGYLTFQLNCMFGQLSLSWNILEQIFKFVKVNLIKSSMIKKAKITFNLVREIFIQGECYYTSCAVINQL